MGLPSQAKIKDFCQLSHRESQGGGNLQVIPPVINVIVGAPIRRPRSEKLRIRIDFRRIRKILPLRAAGRRPYDIVCSKATEICNS